MGADLSDSGKVAECIRIASEYRAIAELRHYSQADQSDVERRLTWRAAIPDKWSPTFIGRLTQVVVIPIVLPFLLLLIYVIAPIVEQIRKRRRQRRILSHGKHFVRENLEALATSTTVTNIYDLWCEHGLCDDSSGLDLDARRQCLERWIDMLYGSGMSVVFRVKQRVEEVRAEHARASAEFHGQGGHISLMDPVDVVARELSGQLPNFRSEALLSRSR